MFKKESIAITTQSHKVERVPRSQTPQERPEAPKTTSRVPTEKVESGK